MSGRILAFDIGIKNLAWCCASNKDCASSNKDCGSNKDCASVSITKQTTIHGWANENLITGGTADSDVLQNQCASCKKKGSYTLASSQKNYCVNHCPPLTPALRDLSGNLLKKIPKLEILKEIASRFNPSKEDLKTKVSVLKFLQSRLCFPKVSAVAVKKVELEALHDGIRAVVIRNKELFASCSQILLENQPAYKNPVMKSVQMMLFATLRDILHPLCNSIPKVRLVHPGRKTAAESLESKEPIIAKGDKGYSDRKSYTENKVSEGLRKGTIRMECVGGANGANGAKDASWFGLQAKKSDLADCLCMVMDA